MDASGVITLANDAALDSLIALCESLRTHSPGVPMTVIPFDDAIDRTRGVVTSYGHELYDDPSLDAMDALGLRYLRDPGLSHMYRKLCAFWGPYERFLLLDADVVVLHELEPYFEAFRRSGADVMHFATDIENVYRPGPVREEMLARHASAGFNAGTFMGRRGALTPQQLREVQDASAAHRHGFINDHDQAFINYVVDVTGLVKVDAHDLVPSLVDAGALMRIKHQGGKLVLADARVPESGREVALIHWAGYHVRVCMPYRRIFLNYRLAQMCQRERWDYRLGALREAMALTTWRTPVRIVKRWRRLGRNILASRGIVGWP
jgi:hypothetical protein